jgi:HK97 family phage major capsid protein
LFKAASAIDVLHSEVSFDMSNQTINRLEELRSAAIAKQRTLAAKVETERRDFTASELAQVDERDGEITNYTERLADEYKADERARMADTSRGRAGGIIRTSRQSAGGRMDREGMEPLERATRAMFDSFLEQRALDTGSAAGPFSSVLNYADCWPALSAKSISIQSGIQTIDIRETSANLPAGTSYTSASFSAELGTAIAADDGFGVSKVTPTRIERLAIVSNDVLETSAFDARRVIVDAMLADISASIDSAVFLGAVGGPAGLINLSGHGTVTGGSVSDLTYFVAAAGTAMVNNSDVRAWAMSPQTWTKLATIQIGGSADKRPLISSDVNAPGAAISGSILGQPIFTSTTFGTAISVVAYDPKEIYLVRRIPESQFAESAGPGLELWIDPLTLMAQNQVRLLLRARVALYVPRPASVVVINTLS